MMSTTVYLAGKIGKNDWRHKLLPGLRGHSWELGPITVQGFKYVGPFFMSCDHGCRHGRSTHGAGGGEGTCIESTTYSPSDIIRFNDTALKSADLVLVYITAPDCYGTMVEVGLAANQPFTRIVVAFAPGIDSKDFWYSTERAAAVHENVCECCLPELLAKELSSMKYNSASTGGAA
jgi:hypothetical protein